MMNNFGETVQEYYTDRDINKKWIFLIIIGGVLLGGAYFGLFAQVGEVSVVPAEEQTPDFQEGNQTFISENRFNASLINMAYYEFQCENDQEIEVNCNVHWSSLLPDFGLLNDGNETVNDINSTGLENPPELNGSATP